MEMLIFMGRIPGSKFFRRVAELDVTGWDVREVVRVLKAQRLMGRQTIYSRL